MRLNSAIATAIGVFALAVGSCVARNTAGADESGLQGQAVSIAELQAVAVSRNPAIAVLDQQIEAARGTTVQAGLPYNPTVGYESEDIGVGGKAGKHGVVLSQEFMTGNKRGYAENASRLEMEVLIRQRDSLSMGVANEVRALAWQVQAARELVAVRTYLKQLADT
ncbi:MAG: TolC family protein, partial [Planctomycetia bacterium]|nr:TolC family protein [Planctomycetia bacterium]